MAERDPETGQFVSDDDNADDTANLPNNSDSNTASSPDTEWHDNMFVDDDDDGLLRDESGGLVDPPVIPAYERELQEAHAANDLDRIADIQERYTEEREQTARRSAARKREQDQQEATA